MSEDSSRHMGVRGGAIARRTKPPSSLDAATKSGRLGAAVRPVSVVALGDGNPPIARWLRRSAR